MTVPPIQPATSAARRGFTLVEILVVIGILALLAAVLLPAINMARRSAYRTAEASALQSIATALDQYQSDHGDYPRFDQSNTGTAPSAGTAVLNENTERGARLLARALFGPAPKTSVNDNPASVSDADLLAAFQDGHESTDTDTFGFKPSRQEVFDAGSNSYAWYLPGKPSGPYLDGGRWNLREAAAGSGFDASVVILDRNEQPYLYYPRRSGTVANSEPYGNVTFDGASRASGGLVSVDPAGARQAGQYNAADNHLHLPAALSGTNVDDDGDGVPDETGLLNYLLGDTNLDGVIGPGETQAYDGPFLLIASDDLSDYGIEVVVNFTPQPNP